MDFCRSVAFVALLALLSTTSAAQALDVLDSQKTITLTVEVGDTYDFALILQDVQEKATLKASGEIDDWIGFWGEDVKTYDINAGQPYIIVTVDVPKNAETGEYEGSILADNDLLVRLRVRATAELSDVKAYEKLTDVGEEVGNLREDLSTLKSSISGIKTQVETLEEDLPGKMEDACGYQEEITDLESANEDLTEQVSSLKEQLSDAEESNQELNDFTGMLVGTQLPGSFVAGIMAGAVIGVVILNREAVRRKLKQRKDKTKHGPVQIKDKEFKYSYSGN